MKGVLLEMWSNRAMVVPGFRVRWTKSIISCSHLTGNSTFSTWTAAPEASAIFRTHLLTAPKQAKNKLRRQMMLLVLKKRLKRGLQT